MPRHPKNIVKRGDKFYLRKMIEGKVYLRSLADTMAEAKRRAPGVEKEIREELARKAHSPDGQAHTVLSWGKEWLARVEVNRNEKGYKLAKKRLAMYVNPFIGDMPLDEVDRGTGVKLSSELLKKGLSPQTAVHVLSDLRAMLRYAALMKQIPAAPDFRTYSRDRVLPEVEEALPDRLTDDEVAKILEHAKGPKRLIIVLALETGMRYGEMLRLQHRHWKKTPYPHIELERTKSKKVRRIPLSPAAIASLKALFEVPRPKNLKEYVVPLRAKHPGIYYRRSQRQLGFHWHFHQLRHTFACRWLEHGGSLTALQEMLGHSDMKLTQRYGRPGEQAVALEAAHVFAAEAGKAGIKTGISENAEPVELAK